MMTDVARILIRVIFVVGLLKRIVSPAPAIKVAPVETLEPNKQKSSSDAVMAA